MTLNSFIIGLFSGFAYSYLFKRAAAQKEQKHRKLPVPSTAGLIINSSIMNGFLLRYVLVGLFLYAAVGRYGLDLASWSCGFLPVFWISILMNTKGTDENFRI